MSFVSTYLNYMGKTEEAFDFYADAFGTKDSLKIMRFKDMPSGPGAPSIPEHEQNMVLHAELTIVAGHILMGTDMLESMGHATRIGNNTTISLNLDSRDEADRLFAIFSDGATEQAGMMDMPYGYWGVALDKYGIRWMFNVAQIGN
jgi:PhnB protein